MLLKSKPRIELTLLLCKAMHVVEQKSPVAFLKLAVMDSFAETTS